MYHTTLAWRGLVSQTVDLNQGPLRHGACWQRHQNLQSGETMTACVGRFRHDRSGSSGCHVSQAVLQHGSIIDLRRGAITLSSPFAADDSTTARQARRQLAKQQEQLMSSCRQVTPQAAGGCSAHPGAMRMRRWLSAGYLLLWRQPFEKQCCPCGFCTSTNRSAAA